MDRTRLYNKVIVDAGDGVEREELDFLDHNLRSFVLERDPLYYRVNQSDLSVPDNIAYKTYGDESLWWVLCLANEISCPCSEIDIGDLLTVPNILDIYDFYKKYRKR